MCIEWMFSKKVKTSKRGRNSTHSYKTSKMNRFINLLTKKKREWKKTFRRESKWVKKVNNQWEVTHRCTISFKLTSMFWFLLDIFAFYAVFFYLTLQMLFSILRSKCIHPTLIYNQIVASVNVTIDNITASHTSVQREQDLHVNFIGWF